MGLYMAKNQSFRLSDEADAAADSLVESLQMRSPVPVSKNKAVNFAIIEQAKIEKAKRPATPKGVTTR
jgi:hypothetical protein